MLSKTCSWSGCNQCASFTETAKDGAPWAYLCIPHHNELEEATASGDAKLVLAKWVKAQGGAKIAAKRMGAI